MLILLLFSVALAVVYALLMMVYARGWSIQKTFHIPGDYKPSVSISVIIPARNEEANIAACIRSVLNSDYPEDFFEIIVIDDHSTDHTAQIVENFHHSRVRCIKLAEHIGKDKRLNAYKKKAIETGISFARGNLIVTTDADCIAPESWLSNIAAMYEQQHPVMIVGPVDFMTDRSALAIFQSLDFMSMQGITAAAHALRLGNMSNGANLAFSRKAFEEVGGYSGIDHLASGDDYLLMMKMQKAYPGGIAYLKSGAAIVRTAPQPTWRSFLMQRIRWASKSGKYDDKTITLILLLVYLFNLSFLALFIAGYAAPILWSALLFLLVFKILTELFYLIPVAVFYRKQYQLLWFPFLQPLHIAYIIVAGLLGFVGVYQWKGRHVK